jgi:hypothetical protein
VGFHGLSLPLKSRMEGSNSDGMVLVDNVAAEQRRLRQRRKL